MSAFNENLSRHVETYSLAQPGTGGFWANVRIIRPVAWVIAALTAVGLEIFLCAIPLQDPKLPVAMKMFLALVPPGILFLAVLLDGYIYADARRRGMRYVMWTLLAIFVPNAIGVILYFLLREPLPTPCPQCGFRARRSFAYCPQCGSELNRLCRNCRARLEPGWTTCAHCGTPIVPVAAQPAPPAKA